MNRRFLFHSQEFEGVYTLCNLSWVGSAAPPSSLPQRSDLGLAWPLQFARSLDLSTERRRVLGTFSCMVWYGYGMGYGGMVWYVPSGNCLCLCLSIFAAPLTQVCVVTVGRVLQLAPPTPRKKQQQQQRSSSSRSSRSSNGGGPARQRRPANKRPERGNERQTHPFHPYTHPSIHAIHTVHTYIHSLPQLLPVY